MPTRAEVAYEFLLNLVTISENSLDEGAECAICKVSFGTQPFEGCRLEHPTRLPCAGNHIFGIECIKDWLSPGRLSHNTCPMCREQLFPACRSSNQAHEPVWASQTSTDFNPDQDDLSDYAPVPQPYEQIMGDLHHLQSLLDSAIHTPASQQNQPPSEQATAIVSSSTGPHADFDLNDFLNQFPSALEHIKPRPIEPITDEWLDFNIFSLGLQSKEITPADHPRWTLRRREADLYLQSRAEDTFGLLPLASESDYNTLHETRMLERLTVEGAFDEDMLPDHFQGTISGEAMPGECRQLWTRLQQEGYCWFFDPLNEIGGVDGLEGMDGLEEIDELERVDGWYLD